MTTTFPHFLSHSPSWFVYHCVVSLKVTNLKIEEILIAEEVVIEILVEEEDSVVEHFPGRLIIFYISTKRLLDASRTN